MSDATPAASLSGALGDVIKKYSDQPRNTSEMNLKRTHKSGVRMRARLL